MVRIAAATHAIRHPETRKKVLLLRPTTNLTDRLGTYRVLAIISESEYSTSYAKSVEFIQEKPSKVIENTQGEPDGIIVGHSKEPQFVPGYQEIIKELDIDRSPVAKERPERGVATDADEIGDLVNSIALTNRSQPAVTRVRVERAERMSKRAGSSLSKSILDRFLR